MTSTPMTPPPTTNRPAAANDNNPRPAWYDKAILDHQALLARMAYGHARRAGEAEEIVQDTIVLALRKWDRYDPQFTFGTWLGLLMKNVMTERRTRATRMKRTGVAVNIDDVIIPARAEQEDALMMSDVLAAFPEGRDGHVLMRRLYGDEQLEIAESMGVSRQRVQQIEERGLQKVRRTITMRKIIRRMKEAA